MISKAQMKATAKYEKAHYDDIRLRVPKGKRQVIKDFATARGESINGFINRLIDKEMKADGN